VRPALEILMGAVLLLLVIVSANILSLLLTRSIARRREMSLRAALGATGWRILRQLLVENAILCAAGGIAGVFLARVAAPVVVRNNSIQELTQPFPTDTHDAGRRELVWRSPRSTKASRLVVHSPAVCAERRPEYLGLKNDVDGLHCNGLSTHKGFAAGGAH